MNLELVMAEVMKDFQMAGLADGIYGDFVREVVKRMTAWQPIDTAPRDGTPVDLWHKIGFRVHETWWDKEDGCWSCVDTDESFTHWMPVPEAPN